MNKSFNILVVAYLKPVAFQAYPIEGQKSPQYLRVRWHNLLEALIARSLYSMYEAGELSSPAFLFKVPTFTVADLGDALTNPLFYNTKRYRLTRIEDQQRPTF